MLLPYTYPTPKLSPHRRLYISTFPKKTHSVWFISVLNYGDTENDLINHLLLVIPMSYPCHYKNVCPHKPHKHAHTHTHTHKATARLRQHMSTKLSFPSRLHQQMHTKARRNDSLEEYPHKRVLFPNQQVCDFFNPKYCSVPSPYRLKCINCTYYGLNSAFKVNILKFKTSVCSKCKGMLITLLAIGANKPHDVTCCDTARWRCPCSKSCNKTTLFL